VPDKPSAVDKALELLARRSHFRRELATKLRRRGYPDEEIETALARVAGYGYLDDHATARQWVEARLARGPEGRRRLASELTRHGADSGVVEEVLSEMLPDDDRPAAREAAERWLERRSGPPRPDALARHLERKGFSEGAIWELLDELRERFA
jgi:regulatory protein